MMRSGTHRPLVTALFGALTLTLALTASILLAPTGIAAAATPVGIDQSEDPAAIAQLSAAAAAANPTASTIALAPGLSGFDNIGADSAVQLNCLSASGFSFDVIDALGAGWDTEYRTAAGLGMSIVLFQGFYQPFWSDPAQGTARGQLMVTNAKSVGYPRGAQVFLNLENNLSDGTSPTTRAGMISWVKNWASEVRSAGFVPGVYVGVPQLLTTADLENAVGSDGVFWRSASSSAPQTNRGYVMRQPTISMPACGTTIDVDISGSATNGAALVGAGFPRSTTPPTVPGAFGPLIPARIMDTRVDGRGQVPASSARRVRILGAGGLPSIGVSAVVLNLTVTGASKGGYLTAYPTGTSKPTASNVNFVAGQTVPNLAVVPVGFDGSIQIYNAADAAVDILADVAGYYLGGTPAAPGAFAPVSPARILDSRVDGGGQVPGTATRQVQILGAGGVPLTGVSAVVLNLTVTNTTKGGYLTAYPTGTSQPTASNVNFVAGQTVPNLVVVPVGSDGTIQIYNSADAPVDMLADVAGYYLGGTPTAAGTLGALPPSRILDTRTDGRGMVPGSSGRAVTVAGQGGVPAGGASAAILNVTVTDTTDGGFITVFPTGVNRPTASNLNFIAGQTVPNLVMVPIGTDGKIMLYNASTAPVDLVADVVGYVI